MADPRATTKEEGKQGTNLNLIIPENERAPLKRLIDQYIREKAGLAHKKPEEMKELTPEEKVNLAAAQKEYAFLYFLSHFIETNNLGRPFDTTSNTPKDIQGLKDAKTKAAFEELAALWADPKKEGSIPTPENWKYDSATITQIQNAYKSLGQMQEIENQLAGFFEWVDQKKQEDVENKNEDLVLITGYSPEKRTSIREQLSAGFAFHTGSRYYADQKKLNLKQDDNQLMQRSNFLKRVGQVYNVSGNPVELIIKGIRADPKALKPMEEEILRQLESVNIAEIQQQIIKIFRNLDFRLLPLEKQNEVLFGKEGLFTEMRARAGSDKEKLKTIGILKNYVDLYRVFEKNIEPFYVRRQASIIDFIHAKLLDSAREIAENPTKKSDIVNEARQKIKLDFDLYNDVINLSSNDRKVFIKNIDARLKQFFKESQLPEKEKKLIIYNFTTYLAYSKDPDHISEEERLKLNKMRGIKDSDFLPEKMETKSSQEKTVLSETKSASSEAKPQTLEVTAEQLSAKLALFAKSNDRAIISRLVSFIKDMPGDNAEALDSWKSGANVPPELQGIIEDIVNFKKLVFESDTAFGLPSVVDNLNDRLNDIKEINHPILLSKFLTNTIPVWFVTQSSKKEAIGNLIWWDGYLSRNNDRMMEGAHHEFSTGLNALSSLEKVTEQGLIRTMQISNLSLHSMSPEDEERLALLEEFKEISEFLLEISQIKMDKEKGTYQTPTTKEDIQRFVDLKNKFRNIYTIDGKHVTSPLFEEYNKVLITVEKDIKEQIKNEQIKNRPKSETPKPEIKSTIESRPPSPQPERKPLSMSEDSKKDSQERKQAPIAKSDPKSQSKGSTFKNVFTKLGGTLRGKKQQDYQYNAPTEAPEPQQLKKEGSHTPSMRESNITLDPKPQGTTPQLPQTEATTEKEKVLIGSKRGGVETAQPYKSQEQTPSEKPTSTSWIPSRRSK